MIRSARALRGRYLVVAVLALVAILVASRWYQRGRRAPASRTRGASPPRSRAASALSSG